MRNGRQLMTGHPCFNTAAQRWFKCIHLPVAPRCNIKCHYCNRRYDCPNENQPATASKVLPPSQAMKKLRKRAREDARISVVGISGPGDSLANQETFEVLERIHAEFPELITCISTNGLLLPDKIDLLMSVGLGAISVTLNTVDPVIGGVIHGWVRYKGEVYEGETGAALLINNQLEGIAMAVARGLAVKINTVLIPGVNDSHMPVLAMKLKMLGAKTMNIVPFVPEAEFSTFRPPTPEEIAKACRCSGKIIRQMANCGQCISGQTHIVY